jgi:hypothetical protein
VTAPYKSNYPDYPDLWRDDALGDIDSRIYRALHPAETYGTGEGNKAPLIVDDALLMYPSLMKQFCIQVRAGLPVDPGRLGWIAMMFERVLAGEPWDVVIPLPGRIVPDDWNEWSPKRRRETDLCWEVMSAMARDNLGAVDAMKKVSVRCAVSYEKVRSAYYSRRAWCEGADQLTRDDEVSIEPAKK